MRKSPQQKLTKQNLLTLILGAIEESGFNYFFIDAKYPFKIRMYDLSQNFNIKVYVWNMTHGGYKRPANEYRIQISGVDIFEQESGFKTLILGYWAEAGVFAGFDISKHLGIPGKSASMQIKEEYPRKAHLNGIAACDKGNGESAIAFTPEFFGQYVENLDYLHQIVSNPIETEILGDIEKFDEELYLFPTNIPRPEKIIKIHKKLRDSSFQKRVLNAYQSKCAFCGVQLKLVEAAPIIPVSSELSTDETFNGISLCSLHHKAYDKGLITFNENYQIIWHEKRIKLLKDQNLAAGLDNFLQNLRSLIILPPASQDRPNPYYITEANKIRDWH